MIPAHIEERIVRLHFVEKWPVGTIAKQVGVHHSTVKRVLRSKGVPVALTARPSMVEPVASPQVVYEPCGFSVVESAAFASR